MKTNIQISMLALLLISGSVSASEPVKCYEAAWRGLGLTAGQAITLCSGATDANKVIQCFAKAWGRPDNGGLGLTAGQAVRLCKTNALPS